MTAERVYLKFKLKTEWLFTTAIVSCIFTLFAVLFNTLEFISTEHIISLLSSVTYVAFILSTLLLSLIFLIWVYSLTWSVIMLGGQSTVSPFANVVWFFVPVLNLIKPYLNMRNIWLGMADNGEIGYGKYLLIKIWWVFFLLSGISAKIAWHTEWQVVDLKSLDTAHYVGLLSIALNLLYIVVLLLFVTDFKNKLEYMYTTLLKEAKGI